MKKVIANRTFRASGSGQIIRAGREVPGDRDYHDQLIKNGLAREAAVASPAPETKNQALAPETEEKAPRRGRRRSSSAADEESGEP